MDSYNHISLVISYLSRYGDDDSYDGKLDGFYTLLSQWQDEVRHQKDWKTEYKRVLRENFEQSLRMVK